MIKIGRGKPAAKSRPRTTTVAFTAVEMTALGRLTEVGQAVLQVRYPVMAKLKAAMTRVGVAGKGRNRATRALHQKGPVAHRPLGVVRRG